MTSRQREADLGGSAGLSTHRRSPRAPLRGGFRSHLPFLLLLVAGAGLRIASGVADRPGIAGHDSAPLLRAAADLVPDRLHTSGYALFLHLIPGWRALWPVVAVQHAAGLAMGCAMYAVLRRRVPAWGAALAAAPVLLDPWQVAVEQHLLPDALFELLVLAGCCALLARRRVSIRLAVAAGLLLGAAVTVRSVGALLFLPAAAVLLLGQARWRPAAALVAAFAVPIAGYAGWFQYARGDYAISDFAARQVYGRVAPFVDCAGLQMPAYERPLCPAEPPGQRPTSYWFVWDARSPAASYRPPPGRTADAVVRDFDLRAVTSQPWAYIRTVGRDFLRGFGPVRTPPAASDRSWARFPAPAYLPGPVLFGCLVLALLAAVGAGRARRSGLRSGAALFALCALTVLATTAATTTFSWRLQLPQLVLLPPAAALGLTALLRRDRDPLALDGHAVSVRLLGRLPLPASLRRLVSGEDRLRMGRYFAGSVICTVVSTVTFLVAFGFGWLGSRGASLLASATGAAVGYYLNRTWTWGRRGRADVRRELVPYWGTVVATAVAAALVTGVVNRLVRDVTTHHGVRTMFDAAAYLGTYLVSFLVKYAVFNRLFGGRRPAADSESEPAEVARDRDPEPTA